MKWSVEFVAWWGAIVGTVALVLEIWKWWRSRASLRVSIFPKTHYADSFSAIEKTEHGETRQLIPHFRIEIANIGGSPTTLSLVSAISRYRRGLLGRSRKRAFSGTMGLDGMAFEPHDGQQLPRLLAPGETWQCRVKENSIASLVQAGKAWLRVLHSLSRKPLYRAFPLEDH